MNKMRDIKLEEKLAICHTCCGPTYRESALNNLQNYYTDNDNIVYCVLTDDKSYFSNLKRKNLVVNELKDFYGQFPALEENEYFLESVDKNDYSEKFCQQKYLFPFSTYRFNLLQAAQFGIKNVAMMPTDGVLDLYGYEKLIFKNKNYIYNAVSNWLYDVTDPHYHSQLVVDRLKSKFGLSVEKNIYALDAAARLFVFDTLERMNHFFVVWNDVIEYLFKTKTINNFAGSYARNDEYILAPIYNAFELTKNRSDIYYYRIFNIQHDVKRERYWRTGGVGGLQEHPNYDQFLKINKERLNQL